MNLTDKHIALAHGNGGRYMRELIEVLFAHHLQNPYLDVQADAVALPHSDQAELLFTTDGFTVDPLEFPGGNIGSLAVHGTTNDLAVSGATPKFLSLNAFIEEGFEVATLERIIRGIAEASKAIGVSVVAGDTKVLRRGEGGGVYLATTGIGFREAHIKLGMQFIKAGDKLLVSGPVGDHGIAVMLAREQFGLRGNLLSDAASVLPFTQSLLELSGLRFMRDPTRGGLATVAHELCRATGLQINLNQSAIPIRDPVNSVCEILGYDPLFLACEGRVVAVVAADQADQALCIWQELPGGDRAAIIGETAKRDAYVVLHTELGGARILDELEDDPLPRIC
ncbi:MAG: hydrogenase expression/formation protein HypE [Candidatus Thiodiazotropha sp.]|jgi:hydrogenase expression/formation protein HypE